MKFSGRKPKSETEKYNVTMVSGTYSYKCKFAKTQQNKPESNRNENFYKLNGGKKRKVNETFLGIS